MCVLQGVASFKRLTTPPPEFDPEWHGPWLIMFEFQHMLGLLYKWLASSVCSSAMHPVTCSGARRLSLVMSSAVTCRQVQCTQNGYLSRRSCVNVHSARCSRRPSGSRARRSRRKWTTCTQCQYEVSLSLSLNSRVHAVPLALSSSCSSRSC